MSPEFTAMTHCLHQTMSFCMSCHCLFVYMHAPCTYRYRPRRHLSASLEHATWLSDGGAVSPKANSHYSTHRHRGGRRHAPPPYPPAPNPPTHFPTHTNYFIADANTFYNCEHEAMITVGFGLAECKLQGLGYRDKGKAGQGQQNTSCA